LGTATLICATSLLATLFPTVSIIKAALRVIDKAIQIHGGAGVSQDTPLARLYAGQRTLRIADGPDEVHRRSIARIELSKYSEG